VLSLQRRRGKTGKVRRSLGFGGVRSPNPDPPKHAVWAHGRERVRTSLALAMQKVVGSSPIIRFKEPANRQVPYSLLATLAALWLHSRLDRRGSWPGDRPCVLAVRISEAGRRRETRCKQRQSFARRSWLTLVALTANLCSCRRVQISAEGHLRRSRRGIRLPRRADRLGVTAGRHRRAGLCGPFHVRK
jgi:hypothetical protein